MSRTKVYRYRVAFDGERDIPAVLDMLRYDFANVEGWDHGASEEDHRTLHGGLRADLYTVRLTAHRFTPERWHSFGLYPTLTEEYWR